MLIFIFFARSERKDVLHTFCSREWFENNFLSRYLLVNVGRKGGVWYNIHDSPRNFSVILSCFFLTMWYSNLTLRTAILTIFLYWPQLRATCNNLVALKSVGYCKFLNHEIFSPYPEPSKGMSRSLCTWEFEACCKVIMAQN